jgi:hypothetical protein
MRSSTVPFPPVSPSIEKKQGGQGSRAPPSPIILWRYHPGHAPKSIAEVYKRKGSSRRRRGERKRRRSIYTHTHNHIHIYTKIIRYLE